MGLGLGFWSLGPWAWGLVFRLWVLGVGFRVLGSDCGFGVEVLRFYV